MLHVIETLLWTIPAFALIMTILVFVHEYGHYIVARAFGVRIIAFSIGMGKELTHRIDKNGVRWRVGAFPVGGYVKFAGDDDASSMTHASSEPGGLADQPLSVRAAVVAAGPLANIFLAFVLTTGLLTINGRWIQPPVIASIVAGSPAEEAGLKPKDTITAIDGAEVSTFIDIAKIIQSGGEVEHNIAYIRNGALTFTKITPEFTIVDQGPFGRNSVAQIGITVAATKDVMHHQTCALPGCAVWAASTVASDASAMLSFFKSLVLGRQSADGLSGPVGIAASAGQIAKTDPAILIAFTSILSLSLGVMNLLPVPILDGGHLAFYLYEAITRRPPSPRVAVFASKLGLSLIIMLIGFTTIHDVFKHILT